MGIVLYVGEVVLVAGGSALLGIGAYLGAFMVVTALYHRPQG